MTRTTTRKLTLRGAASLIALTLAAGNVAAEEQRFDIEAQPLAKALLAFNEQSGLTVAAPRDLVDNKTAPAVRGDMEPEEALDKILSGSGLKATELSTGAYTITLASASLGERTPPAPFRVAQTDREDAVREIDAPDRQNDDDTELDTIVVTGTNIRGIAPESSPVRSFSREDIQISGAATAQDFIQTLPQNFGGGSNETNGGLPGDFGSSFNFGQGSSVNLRGLGSGSTLVLLNGRRLAPSSGLGDFVDISVIPATAIERVDVLTDGASSIYGADAVAGVVNFVLRDDYEGVETSLRYGAVTQGNLDEYRANVTGGESWDTGNALVSYEFYSRTNLSAGDRRFSQGAPLPTDLLPSQRRHSVLASASQDITPNVELSADFGYSVRDAESENTTITSGVFTQEDSQTENLNAAIGLSWKISGDWFVDLSGVYSGVNTDSKATGTTPTDSMAADSLSLAIESDIYTADALISGDLFSAPGGSVKVAFGGHIRTEEFSSFNNLTDSIARAADRDVYALYGEVFIPIIGPENSLPGIERLEVNVSGRYSDFSDFGDDTNPKIGVLWSPVEDVRLRGSYSTSFNPPALGLAGANDATALAYPTALFNSLLGLTPGDPSIADVVGLDVAGTSRSLGAETSRAFTGGVDFDKSWEEHSFLVSATYFDIRFEDRIGTTPIPDNRSVFDAPNIAINSPELFPEGSIVFNPPIEQINAVLASLDAPAIPFFGADPLDAAFISFVGVRRNLSLSRTKGFDFNANYSFNTGQGVFSLGLDGTYLTDFERQAAVTSPVVSVLNTQFNPVDLKLRGSAGYSNDGLSVNVFVNYTDSYRADSTPDAASIDSWTTVDLNIAYDLSGKLGVRALNDMQFRVSVQNLFDEDPPWTPSAPEIGLFGFDPANASPLNRFVSFEVSKKF